MVLRGPFRLRLASASREAARPRRHGAVPRDLRRRNHGPGRTPCTDVSPRWPMNGRRGPRTGRLQVVPVRPAPGPPAGRRHRRDPSTSTPASSSARCASRAVDPVVMTSSTSRTATRRPPGGRGAPVESAARGWRPARPRRARPGPTRPGGDRSSRRDPGADARAAAAARAAARAPAAAGRGPAPRTTDGSRRHRHQPTRQRSGAAVHRRPSRRRAPPGQQPAERRGQREPACSLWSTTSRRERVVVLPGGEGRHQAARGRRRPRRRAAAGAGRLAGGGTAPGPGPRSRAAGAEHEVEPGVEHLVTLPSPAGRGESGRPCRGERAGPPLSRRKAGARSPGSPASKSHRPWRSRAWSPPARVRTTSAVGSPGDAAKATPTSKARRSAPTGPASRTSRRPRRGRPGWCSRSAWSAPRPSSGSRQPRSRPPSSGCGVASRTRRVSRTGSPLSRRTTLDSMRRVAPSCRAR